MGALKNNAGYDQEEAYFHKLNQELIKQSKEKGQLELVRGQGNAPKTEAPKNPKAKK